MAEVVKTPSFREVRSILAAEIAKLRAGDTTAANVNAVTNAVGKLLSSYKLEIEISKLLGKKPNATLLTEGDATQEDAQLEPAEKAKSAA
jgi:hypothetical protein